MTTTIKGATERPIIFSAPMVRAILNGSKAQTRRVMKLPPRVERYGPRADVPRFYSNGSGQYPGGNPNFTGDQPPGAKVSCEETCQTVPCPYGHIGDRLWVRESAYIAPPNFGDRDLATFTDREGRPRMVGHAASMDGESCEIAEGYGVKKTPSIHMPRWASRLTLEVTAVRVERLQAISDADALAEGVQGVAGHDVTIDGEWWPGAPVRAFRKLWGSINGPESWEANPWVWVIEFRQVTPSAQKDEAGKTGEED